MSMCLSTVLHRACAPFVTPTLVSVRRELATHIRWQVGTAEALTGHVVL